MWTLERGKKLKDDDQVPRLGDRETVLPGILFSQMLTGHAPSLYLVSVQMSHPQRPSLKCPKMMLLPSPCSAWELDLAAGNRKPPNSTWDNSLEFYVSLRF